MAVFGVVLALGFASASVSPRVSRALTDATEGPVTITCDRARGQCEAQNHGWAASDGSFYNIDLAALRSVACEPVPGRAGAVHVVLHGSTARVVSGEAVDPREQASQREAVARVRAFLADPAAASVSVRCAYGSAPNPGGLIVGVAVLAIVGGVLAYARRLGRAA